MSHYLCSENYMTLNCGHSVLKGNLKTVIKEKFKWQPGLNTDSLFKIDFTRKGDSD